jgi:GTPase SAR1 family protein
LEELGPIVRTLREVKGESAMIDVPIVLVGNKMDEHGRREVKGLKSMELYIDGSLR